jgi:hypothetical protein
MSCCGQNRERAVRLAQLRASHPDLTVGAPTPAGRRRLRRGAFPPALWLIALAVLAVWTAWAYAVARLVGRLLQG